MTVFLDTELADIFAPLKGLGKVALAVSGGADSMALVALASHAPAILQDCPEFLVLTVDHGLRVEAKQETALVAKAARRFGFDCQILGGDRNLARGNLQAAARDLRYRLMTEACHALGVDTLVTAHHLEDQAETFLLRLARGSGVDGLGAMAPQSWCRGVRLIRPFLDTPKARLRDFLVAAHPDIGWVEDPSNDDLSFDRVKFRKLAPRLKDAGLTPKRLVETARRMRDAEQVLERAADDLAARAVRVDPAGHCTIDRAEIAGSLQDTRLRLLSRCLTAIGGQTYRPRMTRLQNIMDAIVSTGECRRTLAGCVVGVGDERIDIWREPGRRGLPEITLGPGDTKIWDGRFRVDLEDTAGQPDCHPVTVRALGRDGLRIARDQADISGSREQTTLARTYVSFWQSDRLIAVPHLSGFPAKSALHADFLGSRYINPQAPTESRNL
jgi:tRNA(Ile)-lysidine synthase